MSREHLIPLTGLLPAWLRTPLLPVAIGKEWHAIGPFWLASLLAACLAGLAPDEGITVLGLVTLVITHAAVGASVVGHEFAHRTLGLLLLQPEARDRLWRRKMGVSLAALLSSSAPLLLRLVVETAPNGSWPFLLLAIGAILSGWCVAPCLTLLTRSTLAGTVFTAVLPFLYLLAGGVVSLGLGLLGDWVSPWEERIGIACFVLLLGAQWPLGAYLGWRKFLALEDLDAHGQELRLPVWRRKAAADASRRARNGGWRTWVIRKELRLQHVTFLVAAVFVALWGVVVAARLVRPSLSLDMLGFASPIYTWFIGLLAGALACAEERHFGTLNWQLTLPVSAARQWAWKAGVVWALALAAGVLLPALLRALTPFEDLRIGAFELDWGNWFLLMVPMTSLLTGMALYVSSVCQTTIRALLVSVLLAILLVMLLSAVLGSGVLGVLVSGFGAVCWTAPLPERPAIALLAVLTGVAAGAHGLANYRTVEQRFGRVVKHAAVLCSYPLLALGLYVAAGFGLGYLRPEEPAPDYGMDRPLPPLATAGAALLSPGDFSDLGALAGTLARADTAIAADLSARLSTETRHGLAHFPGAGPSQAPAAARLIEDLNRIIQAESLYSVERFAGVRFRPLLRELAETGPPAEMTALVNRMLIEDAVPDAIARGPMQIMLREGMVRERSLGGDPPPGAGEPQPRAFEVRLYPAIRGVFRPAARAPGGEATNAGASNRPGMDLRTLMRYGLVPRTNAPAADRPPPR